MESIRATQDGRSVGQDPAGGVPRKVDMKIDEANLVSDSGTRANSGAEEPPRWTRRDLVYFVLGGFFLTNALVAELTGGKLFQLQGSPWTWLGLGGVTLSIGVIPWPVVFISTDLINEYFGKSGVRRLTFLAVGMIAYAFVILTAAVTVPAWEKSPVSQEAFRQVFRQSQWIIVGSLTAFLVSQLVDVLIFHAVRSRTGGRLLWLRSTGSTVISQLVDSFLVGYIAFVLPGSLAFGDFLRLGVGNYLFKLTVAILITPLIYLGHGLIDRYLGIGSHNK